MTASATTVSLSNRALLMVGARAQVSSLTEGSQESDAISTLFVPTFEALARTANWNCLRQQAVLSLLAAAAGTPENQDGTTLPLPPSPWLYQYAVPSNSLEIRSILPSLTSSQTGQVPMTTVSNAAPTLIPGQRFEIPFAVAYATNSSDDPINVVLTNQTQAQAIYTVNQPNPVVWDSLFEAAFVASLAAYLVPALSLNLELMAMQIRTAESQIASARVRDGDEGTTVVDHVPDWIRARSSGTFVLGAGDGGMSYPGMLWPVI